MKPDESSRFWHFVWYKCHNCDCHVAWSQREIRSDVNFIRCRVTKTENCSQETDQSAWKKFAAIHQHSAKKLNYTSRRDIADRRTRSWRHINESCLRWTKSLICWWMNVESTRWSYRRRVSSVDVFSVSSQSIRIEFQTLHQQIEKESHRRLRKHTIILFAETCSTFTN